MVHRSKSAGDDSSSPSALATTLIYVAVALADVLSAGATLNGDSPQGLWVAVFFGMWAAVFAGIRWWDRLHRQRVVDVRPLTVLVVSVLLLASMSFVSRWFPATSDPMYAAVMLAIVAIQGAAAIWHLWIWWKRPVRS